MFDPCCGSSLRRGTKLIAYIDMGLAVLQALFSGLFLLLVIGNYDELRKTFDQDEEDFPNLAALFDLKEDTLILIFSLTSVYFVAMFFLARYLFHGAEGRDHIKLQCWYNLMIILVFIRIIFFVSGLLFSSAIGAFGIFGIIYQIYCLWIVRAYITQLSRSAYCEFIGETSSLKAGAPKYIYVVNNI